MNKKVWGVLALAALLVTLTTCGSVGSQPIQAAGEQSPVLGGGGGGVVLPSGQFVEGLVVVGTGATSAEPEIAVVTFGVELRGDDPAALVDEGAQKIDQAIAAVKKLNVADEDIRTTGYNLWVENLYSPETGAPTGEVVYHVSHFIQVSLHDLDKVGSLLADVVAAGVNSISGVSFTVEKPETLVEQARQEALADAAAKAKQMAGGLGITLGKPVLVMETGGGYSMPSMEWGIGGGGGGVVAPSISPGSFAVSVSVQVVYEIR